MTNLNTTNTTNTTADNNATNEEYTYVGEINNAEKYTYVGEIAHAPGVTLLRCQKHDHLFSDVEMGCPECIQEEEQAFDWECHANPNLDLLDPWVFGFIYS